MDVERAGEFGAELKHWRNVRGLSQRKLADQMDYDDSYISKIETGQEPPSQDFAKIADEILGASGALFRRFKQEKSTKEQGRPVARPTGIASSMDDQSGHLVVQHEDARLAYDDGVYFLRTRRQLRNDGEGPVTNYLIRIAVDSHPDDGQKSKEFYRSNGLEWDELQLKASCDDEPMNWDVKKDRDELKEVWLKFENEHGRFPLYPGKSVWIEYSYTVARAKWGNWYQRSIRKPTERLSVQLDFPTELAPAAWGTEISATADNILFRDPITEHEENGRKIFSWSTIKPPIDSRFKLEWTFHKDDNHVAKSDDMESLGIVQKGESILNQTCEPFSLPAEAVEAEEIAERLLAYLGPLRANHTFGKGMGLAAPQIGIPRALAVVQQPGAEPLVLYNPTIIDQSEETDEQYEGCLSFFDVRGKVERPLCIEVEHTTLEGKKRIITFEKAAARLWAHEIDHLNGTLYLERMASGEEPIAVESYKASTTGWNY